LRDTGDWPALLFPSGGKTYRGSVPLSDLALLPNDPAVTMRNVTEIYTHALAEIQRWQKEVKVLRSSKTPIPVRKAWELGDALYRLETGIAQQGCQIESFYDHLERDANLSPKRATSFVTLRRYVQNAEAIPEELQWNKILKTVKSSSQAIATGATNEV
jgi:uncharacterized phage infection (PIP) family protein YhgE